MCRLTGLSHRRRSSRDNGVTSLGIFCICIDSNGAHLASAIRTCMPGSATPGWIGTRLRTSRRSENADRLPTAIGGCVSPGQQPPYALCLVAAHDEWLRLVWPPPRRCPVGTTNHLDAVRHDHTRSSRSTSCSLAIYDRINSRITRYDHQIRLALFAPPLPCVLERCSCTTTTARQFDLATTVIHALGGWCCGSLVPLFR